MEGSGRAADFLFIYTPVFTYNLILWLRMKVNKGQAAEFTFSYTPYKVPKPYVNYLTPSSTNVQQISSHIENLMKG